LRGVHQDYLGILLKNVDTYRLLFKGVHQDLLGY
jgi:hypothetical protein